MTKYTLIAGVVLLACLLFFPMTAASQGTTTEKQTTTMEMKKDKGHMMGMPGMNLTSEQRDKISKLHQMFREENADTLKQLMTKQFDLRTIFDSTKPDAEKAKAVQKDISDLKAKLAQKRIDLYFEVRKINPDAKFGYKEGNGQGMRGMGMGHGRN